MIKAVRLLALSVVANVALALPAGAFDLSGVKHVVAHTKEGKDIVIGTVTFTPQGDRTSYKLDMDMSRFKEFFLSMRPFKCLEGPDIWCYVPYPYEHPHIVSAKDYGWLEHDLLFFWKTPSSYGAKMNNGLIYAFGPTDKALVGKPQAINLDKIASPPDDLATPPYGPADRDDIQDGSRWIESVRIE